MGRLRAASTGDAPGQTLEVQDPRADRPGTPSPLTTAAAARGHCAGPARGGWWRGVEGVRSNEWKERARRHRERAGLAGRGQHDGLGGGWETDVIIGPGLSLESTGYLGPEMLSPAFCNRHCYSFKSNEFCPFNKYAQNTPATRGAKRCDGETA